METNYMIHTSQKQWFVLYFKKCTLGSGYRSTISRLFCELSSPGTDSSPPCSKLSTLSVEEGIQRKKKGDGGRERGAASRDCEKGSFKMLDFWQSHPRLFNLSPSSRFLQSFSLSSFSDFLSCFPHCTNCSTPKHM